MLPDAHKMRDFAFDLDWRVMSGGAGEKAPLIQLVRHKAGQERGTGPVDVLSYFPEKVRLGGNSGPRRTPNRLPYLLNLTRHTPRDVLQLMEHTRRASIQIDEPDQPKLSLNAIREGVLQYSVKYFVDAIHGEFAGYQGGREEAEAALNALKWMSESKFTRADYKRSLATHFLGIGDKGGPILATLVLCWRSRQLV